MSSKLVTTEKHEDRPVSSDWSGPEISPSVMRDDEANLPRYIGMFGAFLVIFGGLVLVLKAFGRSSFVSPSWAMLSISLGLAALLYHAAFDKDVQFRRMYMLFGFLALAVGAFLCFLPYPNATGDQFGSGFLCMSLALVFLLAFHRNEMDLWIRNLTQLVIGGSGLLMAVIGLVGGNVKVEFLLPFGLLLSVLGLVYLAAFTSTRGIGNDLGYRAGLGVGLAGLLVFLAALGRSALPPLFHSWKWLSEPPAEYTIPSGLVLMFVGAVYGLTSLGICSEAKWVILTRRELGAFFYAPVAYILLFGFAVFSWIAYFFFVYWLVEKDALHLEPIVGRYGINLWTVFVIIFVPSVLTMRLLSEEQRSGTLEVLLTAPVEEGTVVISKFLAALLLYMAVWVPAGLYLLAFRLAGADPFDYRPLLSFFIGLMVTGAGFISMGLLCSSLTRSQVASGLLTFVGMVGLTAIALARWQFFQPDSTSAWAVVLGHLSYLTVWDTTLQGKLEPRQLLFFLSLTILCLFMTVKVLESRKWR